MAVTGPITGFSVVDPNTGNPQDLGNRYVSKDYLLDVYPNLVPGRTSPGLWAWGINDSYRLGLGDVGRRSSPVQVGSLTNWKQVTVGTHGVAIKTDGTLWSWGANDLGQLGLGDGGNRTSPVQVGSLTNWKQVDSNYYSPKTGAIKTDGTLWTWGSNSLGQLGLGDMTNRNSPVQVGTLTTWKKITVGRNSMAAIKTDGTLWIWGSGQYGELGLGNENSTSSPVQVGSSTDWKQISAGFFSYYAIKTDGTLWSWGHNSIGTLGLGDRIFRSSPVQVGSLTNWKNVASLSSVLAIKTDGTLWAWGNNGEGQLGLGNRTTISSPVQVGTLTNWKQVAVTGVADGSYAIKTDGTLWAWGQNTFGELGFGDTTDRSSPVQVGTLTTWKQIDAGENSVLAIQDGYL